MSYWVIKYHETAKPLSPTQVLSVWLVVVLLKQKYDQTMSDYEIRSGGGGTKISCTEVRHIHVHDLRQSWKCRDSRQLSIRSARTRLGHRRHLLHLFSCSHTFYYVHVPKHTLPAVPARISTYLYIFLKHTQYATRNNRQNPTRRSASPRARIIIVFIQSRNARFLARFG